MSETKEPVSLEKIAKTTLFDVRVVLGIAISIIISLFGGGWYAFGQVRAEGAAGANDVLQARLQLDAARDARIAAIEERQLASDAAVNHRLDRFENTLTRVLTNQEGLRDDLQKAFPTRIPARPDGGN
jgi:hypothetical protein